MSILIVDLFDIKGFNYDMCGENSLVTSSQHNEMRLDIVHYKLWFIKGIKSR